MQYYCYINTKKVILSKNYHSSFYWNNNSSNLKHFRIVEQKTYCRQNYKRKTNSGEKRNHTGYEKLNEYERKRGETCFPTSY